MSARTYDFIVFGATSFVGKILSNYLVQNYEPGELNWAMAARSESKLNELKAELGEKGANIPTLIADAANAEQLTNMCVQAKVIVSTVGPYALYGEPLVKVCCDTGTDYCDLTGEAQWIADMLGKYESVAQESGARIVNSCGFDSIPSDLGVFFLQEHAKEKFDEYCFRVKLRVKAMKGGASGGTIASMLNIAKQAAKDPELRRQLVNPYVLCPDGHPFFARQANNNKAKFDEDFKRWTAPFVMEAINTRIVHRSNALRDAAYGKNFLYDEAMFAKGKGAATGMSFGMGGFMLAAAIAPFRGIMERFILPKPGEGPSPEEQENGFYDLRLLGETGTGKVIKAKVTGDKDPGYGSTAKILAETALLLVDKSKTDLKGGFWTPSTAFGMPLVDRLVDKAGLTFELMED